MPRKGTVSIYEIRMKKLPVLYLPKDHFLLGQMLLSQRCPVVVLTEELRYHVLTTSRSLPPPGQRQTRGCSNGGACHICPDVSVAQRRLGAEDCSKPRKRLLPTRTWPAKCGKEFLKLKYEIKTEVYTLEQGFSTSALLTFGLSNPLL